MSRTNSKVAHLLREADTLKTNKAVLKAGSLPRSTDVFEVLDESSNKFEDKMAKLLKFNARNKKTFKTSSHKTEWMDEQTRLQNLANKLELSIGSTLDTAIAHSPGDEDLLELTDISAGYHNARMKNQAEITGQLHNIKEMLREATKRANSDKAANESEEMKQAQMATTQAFIAELFIKLRTDQAKVWHYWQTQERELRKAVQQCAHELNTAIRNDGLVAQDEKLRAEFAAIVSLGTTMSVRASGDLKAALKGGIGHCSGGSPGKDSASITASSVLNDPTELQQRLETEMEMVMDEWLHKIALLDKAQELRAVERETERALLQQEYQTTSSGSVSDGKNTGWPETDHEMFVKIYKKAHITGMPRKQLLQILTAELPEHSLEDIVHHEEWYRRWKLIGSKYKEYETAYTQARAEMIELAKTALLEHRTQTLEMIEREREAELHERHRMEINNRLQELWAEKEAIDGVKRAEREKLEAELRARLAEQEESLRKERLEKKQQVEKYRALKEAAEAEAQRQHAEQLAQAQEAVRRLIEQNRPNVERREQLRNEKEDRRRQKEMEQEMEELRRIELLNKLASQVPYYGAIMDAQSRLDHVTASAKAHEYVPSDDPLYRGHLPLNGFTDNKVIQDSRFRLAEALRRCGVAGSQAARAAVAQFYPRPHLAIHGII